MTPVALYVVSLGILAPKLKLAVRVQQVAGNSVWCGMFCGEWALVLWFQLTLAATPPLWQWAVTLTCSGDKAATGNCEFTSCKLMLANHVKL